MSDDEADVTDPIEPEREMEPEAEPEPAPLAAADPAPNVVLEYRNQPGSEHLEIYLPAMADAWRPHTVHYGGTAFVQSRQRGDGLWVYGSEG